MKDRILKLYRRYREVVNYVFFGGLTTLVNIAGYALLRKLGVPSDPATWTATAVSILFAYFTNRRWEGGMARIRFVRRVSDLDAAAGCGHYVSVRDASAARGGYGVVYARQDCDERDRDRDQLCVQ